MQDYNIILKQMANKSISLWRGARSSSGYQVPTAIVGNSDKDSVFEISSIITDTRFDFDDQIINSKAYRRALVNLQQAQGYLEQLDNELDKGRQSPDNLEEGSTLLQTGNISPSVDAPDVFTQTYHHELAGMGEEAQDVPVPTPAENEGLMTEPAYDHIAGYVHPQLALDRFENKDPKDDRFQNSVKRELSEFDMLHGQGARYFAMPPQIEHSPPLPLPSHPEIEDLQQETAGEAKEHLTGSLSPLSEPTPSEVSDQTSESVTKSSPKRSSWRFQRFFSGLLKPSSSTEIKRKLVLVGDPCGKTSLALAFCKGHFPEQDIPTIFDNYVADVEIDGKAVELAIWDTAGLGDYDNLRPLSYPDSHVVLLCFSVANRDSYENVQYKWISEVLHFCQGIPIILVGTEKDCRDNGTHHSYGNTRKPITTAEGEELRRLIGADKYVECSAKTAEGVRDVFVAAIRAALLVKRKKR
ncbi:GTP-binding protein Rho1, variant 2 [Arthrobotrys conoides]